MMHGWRLVPLFIVHTGHGTERQAVAQAALIIQAMNPQMPELQGSKLGCSIAIAASEPVTDQ